MIFDYTLVDQPRLRLTLEEVEPDAFMVYDQHGREYTLCPVDLDFAVRFMRRFAVLRHAELDEGAITYWRACRQFGDPHSVRVGALAGRELRGIKSGGGSYAAAPTPDSRPANVLEFRKRTA